MLSEGTVALNGTLETIPVPRRAAILNLKDVSLRAVLERLASLQTLDGLADLRADLTAVWDNLPAIVRTPAIVLQADSGKGRLHGLDMAALNKHLITGGVGPNPQVVGQNRVTSFRSLAGTIHFANGIARTEDLRLTGRDRESPTVAALNLPTGKVTAFTLW